GGEPLIRRDLAKLIRMLAAIPGITDIALSTNGMMLAQQIGALVDAGLKRVNVSLDTLREDRFFDIARRRGLDRVLAGIDAAVRAGLEPVKINCVVMRGRNDDEVADLAGLTRDRAVFMRFIEVMPVEENLDLQREAYISVDEILERIRAVSDLVPVEGPPGNGPARYFAFPGARGAVGVISPLSHDYCERCNRVRLSASGQLRLCLFGDNDIDLKTPVRSGASRDDLIAIFQGSMFVKPERHFLKLGEQASRMRAFSEIGG
ncbi:MAG: radical SAM protein, partial [Candidatus Eremiobacteraeota bacterium]|nr:radical SAM protein [Candidatus Eremiobacteraeota bacterium]